MVKPIKKKKYGSTKPEVIKRLEKWGDNYPVVPQTLSFFIESMMNSSQQDKYAIMRFLRRIFDDFSAHHSDYLPVTDDEQEWKDLEIMERILLDVCQFAHDSLAIELGEPNLNDVLKSESDERFAEGPLGGDTETIPDEHFDESSLWNNPLPVVGENSLPF